MTALIMKLFYGFYFLRLHPYHNIQINVSENTAHRRNPATFCLWEHNHLGAQPGLLFLPNFFPARVAEWSSDARDWMAHRAQSSRPPVEAYLPFLDCWLPELRIILRSLFLSLFKHKEWHFSCRCITATAIHWRYMCLNSLWSSIESR